MRTNKTSEKPVLYIYEEQIKLKTFENVSLISIIAIL